MRRTHLLPLAALLAAAGACTDAGEPITAPAAAFFTKTPGSDTTITNCGSSCVSVISGAATRFQTVRLGSGTFQVSGTINLPSDTRIVGAGKLATIIRQDVPGAHVFKAAGSGISFVTQITVDSIGFKGTGSGSGAALRAETVQNVNFRWNRADSIGLIQTDINPGGYANASAATLSRNVVVTGNYGTGPIGGNTPTIQLSYTRDGTITHDTVTNAANGILAWGGDANHNVNGQLGNPRWARNILMQHNRVTSVGFANVGFTGAGIMASMGDSVSMLDNQVHGCTDVCLDLEGSINSNVSGNTASNAGFAVLSAFFLGKNNRFTWNNVTQDGSYGTVLFGLKNATLAESEVTTWVHNNTFAFTGASGVGHFTKEASEALYFINNGITNAVIDMDGCYGQCQYNGYLEITGNTFHFTRNAGVPVIKVGHTWFRAGHVAGNTFTTTTSQTGAGIHVILNSHPWASSGDLQRVYDNQIGGFSPSLVAESSSGMGQTFHMYNNTGSGPCKTIFTGGGAHTLSVTNSWGAGCFP
jgi:parallel beta-helix repeat protein